MDLKSFSMNVRVTPTNREFIIEVPKPATLKQLKEICVQELGENIDIKLVFLGKILKESDDLALILKPNGLIFLFKQQKRTEINGLNNSSVPLNRSLNQGPPNFEGMGFPGYGGIYGIGGMGGIDDTKVTGNLSDFIKSNPIILLQCASQILSNPLIASMLSESGGLKNIGNLGGLSSFNSSADISLTESQNLKQLYSNQLSQLKNMNIDEEKGLKALKASNGNLNEAIGLIFGS